jgi:hypothetical protein
LATLYPRDLSCNHLSCLLFIRGRQVSHGRRLHVGGNSGSVSTRDPRSCSIRTAQPRYRCYRCYGEQVNPPFPGSAERTAQPSYRGYRCYGQRITPRLPRVDCDECSRDLPPLASSSLPPGCTRARAPGKSCRVRPVWSYGALLTSGSYLRSPWLKKINNAMKNIS